MNIINIKLGVDTQPCSAITLGRRGENEVTQVVVDFSSWVGEFGAGVITLLAMRSQDTSAYPVVLSLDGNTATWNVTSTDTAYKGSGRAEYIYTVGEQIAKSVVFNTVVMQDIGEPSETPPDPYEDWLERLTELGAETQANAEAAQQSAEDAEQSAQEAAQEAANAEGYAEQAGESASAAQSAEAASESARDAAQTAQANAESFAAAASGAEAAAETAQGKAEDAQDAAEAAQATAESAKAGALAAQGAAETAQGKAEDAQAAAEQAAQDAHVEYEQLSGEVDDLSDEVADQKSAIEDLEALTNRKAGMLVDTASGAIASFVPDATIPNLLGVSVDIEPVQDLHGYDSPWPGGGGTNLLNPGISETLNGVTKTVNSDGTITFTGTATAATDFYFNGTAASYTDYPLPNGTYHIEGSEGGGSPTYDFFWIYQQGGTTKYANGRDHTPVTVDGIIPSRIFFRVYPEYTINLTANLGLFAGNYQSNSWTPYENICPISGWDAVEIDAAGVNLFDVSKVPNYGTSIINNGDGTLSIKTPSASTVVVGPATLRQLTDAQAGTIVTLSANTTGSDRLFYLYGANQSWRFGTSLLLTDALLDSRLSYYASGVSTEATISDIQIEVGTTASAYKPYAGNRYTIQLGQTVYGAKLTIAEDGSVTALIDRAKVDMGALNWAAYSAGVNTYRTQIAEKALGDLNLICSAYKTEASTFANMTNGTIRGTTGNAYVYARDNNYTDVTSFKSAVTGQTIVYKLATPIEIQLDPVTISTISGQTNNVWSDASDVSVTYAADIKAYIDRMNQPTEDDMIANSLIAANKYFTVNNRLFLSTASIAAGAMIIPGTNCQETSLAAALNALNA